MGYAVTWVAWEQTGFDPKQCPWRNPYEMRKRKPICYEDAKKLLAEQSQ